MVSVIGSINEQRQMGPSNGRRGWNYDTLINGTVPQEQ